VCVVGCCFVGLVVLGGGGLGGGVGVGVGGGGGGGVGGGVFGCHSV